MYRSRSYNPAIAGTYFVDNETGKTLLNFTYEEYKALPYEVKKLIKSYFLFSKSRAAWVSKSQGGSFGVLKVINELNLENGGTVGKKLSFEEEQAKKEERAHRYTETSDKEIKDYVSRFSKRNNEDYNRYSVFFTDTDLNKRVIDEVEDMIQKINKNLGLSDISEAPDYVKHYLNKYIDQLVEFYHRETSIRLYAPSPYAVGPSNYPVNKLPKAARRRDANYRDLDEALSKLRGAVAKSIRSSRVEAGKFSRSYISNRIKEIETELREVRRRLYGGWYSAGRIGKVYVMPKPSADLQEREEYLAGKLNYFIKVGRANYTPEKFIPSPLITDKMEKSLRDLPGKLKNPENVIFPIRVYINEADRARIQYLGIVITFKDKKLNYAILPDGSIGPFRWGITENPAFMVREIYPPNYQAEQFRETMDPFRPSLPAIYTPLVPARIPVKEKPIRRARAKKKAFPEYVVVHDQRKRKVKALKDLALLRNARIVATNKNSINGFRQSDNILM